MNWCAHRSGNVLHSSAPEVHSSFRLHDHNPSTCASHFRVDPHTPLQFWLESLALHRAVLRVIVVSSPVEDAWLGNKLLGSWDLRFFWSPADGDQGYLTREESLRVISAVAGRGPCLRSNITGRF